MLHCRLTSIGVERGQLETYGIFLLFFYDLYYKFNWNFNLVDSITRNEDFSWKLLSLRPEAIVMLKSVRERKEKFVFCKFLMTHGNLSVSTFQYHFHYCVNFLFLCNSPFMRHFVIQGSWDLSERDQVIQIMSSISSSSFIEDIMLHYPFWKHHKRTQFVVEWMRCSEDVITKYLREFSSTFRLFIPFNPLQMLTIPSYPFRQIYYDCKEIVDCRCYFLNIFAYISF